MSSTAPAISAIHAARSSPQASRDKDEVLTADLDLDMIGKCARRGSFSGTGGPDTYESLVSP